MNQKFREQSFWKKVRAYAAVIGCPLLCTAFKLFYALKNPKTPTWARGVIYGALGYFISIIDAVPDITPIAGYSDDALVLAAALATLAVYVDDKAKQAAREQVRKLIPECEC